MTPVRPAKTAIAKARCASPNEPANHDAAFSTQKPQTHLVTHYSPWRLPDEILVTGGGGFLGQAICSRLVSRGHEVLSFNRGTYSPLAALGVRQIQGDLASFETVIDAARGVDAIFHVAAKAGAWGSFREYFDANVRGTRHVLAACHINGVKTLIHTSTPSVAHRGTTACESGNEENTPLAKGFKAWYPASKRVAEEMVLAANECAAWRRSRCARA
jgi:nucleoside-diphosphate-sugar epimerase